MSDISSIALSGLNDAVRRVTVAAGNIARAGVANNPASIANSGGGPVAAPVAAPVTGQGGVQVAGLVPQDGGDGNITGSILDLKQAEIGYKANLAVIKVDDRLQRELLNDFRV